MQLGNMGRAKCIVCPINIPQLVGQLSYLSITFPRLCPRLPTRPQNIYHALARLYVGLYQVILLRDRVKCALAVLGSTVGKIRTRHLSITSPKLYH